MDKDVGVLRAHIEPSDVIEGNRTEWRDISAAPKDGTKIIYHNGKTTDAVIGYCLWTIFREEDFEAWWDYERDDEACPKFWMPEIPLPKGTPGDTVSADGGDSFCDSSLNKSDPAASGGAE